MSEVEKRAWSCLGCGLLWAITLSACGTQPATPLKHPGHPAAVDAGIVQSLQQQLRERERRIAELESQLDALKVIDQDMKNRRTFSRPPTTVTPIE